MNQRQNYNASGRCLLWEHEPGADQVSSARSDERGAFSELGLALAPREGGFSRKGGHQKQAAGRHLSRLRQKLRTPLSRAFLIRITVPRTTHSCALTLSSFYRFEALLLAQFQIECVFLNILNDFLIHHFSFETLEGALQAFAVL